MQHLLQGKCHTQWPSTLLLADDGTLSGMYCNAEPDNQTIATSMVVSQDDITPLTSCNKFVSSCNAFSKLVSGSGIRIHDCQYCSWQNVLDNSQPSDTCACTIILHSSKLFLEMNLHHHSVQIQTTCCLDWSEALPSLLPHRPQHDSIGSTAASKDTRK